MNAPLPASAAPILVVAHDPATRDAVAAALDRATVVPTIAEAEACLAARSFGVLIVEDELPGETGLMFLARINDRFPWLRRVLVCAQLESDLLVFLINEANIFRCVTKPVEPSDLRAVVAQAVADHRQARQLAECAADSVRLRAELAGAGPLAHRGRAALGRWGPALPRIFLLSSVAAAWILLLGVVVLLALYGIKSFLGIDLVAGLHLRDLVG